MKFPDLKVGDQVIGVHWDRDYYPMIVTKLTPTRFLTDAGLTFIIESGRRWGREIGYQVTGRAAVSEAVPYDEELYQKALDQQSARRQQRDRERLVNRLYSRLQDVRKPHICQHSNERLQVILETIEDLISPQTKRAPTDIEVDETPNVPTSEQITQKINYEDSFTD